MINKFNDLLTQDTSQMSELGRVLPIAPSREVLATYAVSMRQSPAMKGQLTPQARCPTLAKPICR